MAKIAFDCDGVLARFIKAFAEEANCIWPGRFPNPGEYAEHGHTQWNFDPAILTNDEVKQVWKRINGTVNWWMRLDAHTDSVGALAVWLWTHKLNDVYVVTARQETLGQTVAFQTMTWIRACGVDPVHNYLGVVPIDGHDKAQFYKLAGIEWSIDDRDVTVQECDALMPDRTHRAFLLDRPWNQGAQVRHRVKSVQEYLDAIDKLG